MNQRASGILLHPTSLYNHYPVGDIGPAAFAFVDFLAESGQSFWQMLPIGPTGEESSPYQLASAFAGNPSLISPDKLVEQGLLQHHDLEIPVAQIVGKVAYSATSYLKQKWLKQAFMRFEESKNNQRQDEFNVFIRTESFWLDDFALFLTLQEKEGVLNWTKWSQELRTRELSAIIQAQKDFASVIRYHQFVQWQFALQWQELKAYCNFKGVKLIGDVPLFVAHLSADVWAHPELFKLDINGNPTVVAGVPPDYFSGIGQIWDVPVYNWEVMQAQNYVWWIWRLRKAFARFDVNRLDHFIGFVHSYEISVLVKTARSGQYHPGPGMAFFQVVHDNLGLVSFIADDLGMITPEVVALLDQLNIPGTQVLQFDFELRSKINLVIYTSTHDNDTTAGWYEKLPSAKRQDLQAQLGVSDQEIVWTIISKAMVSSANTAIIPLQDLLELGSEARMNTPGTAEGNWQWRMQDKVLTVELAQKLHDLTISCGRTV